MDRLRIGVIGCGVIAKAHFDAIQATPRAELAAVADSDEAKLDAARIQYPDVETFTDGLELIHSGRVDAISIATPHYSHPPLAIAAFKEGLHVLTEKPIAVTTKAGQAMIEAASKRPALVFAAMFQARCRPQWQTVKRLVDTGEVGELVRVNWTITTQFRTQTYYDSAGWRATWKGEGGGLLINQCPHNLDILQWLTGMPERVSAQVSLGRFHDIEVEDEVTAMMRFPNGASGTFITSSGEAPGVNRFELVGDRSTVIVEPGKPIEWLKHDQPVSHYCATTANRSALPPCSRYTIEPAGEYAGHNAIMQNFVNAILDGKPLIAPGEAGLGSLELANAMLRSGLEQRPIDLPVDPDTFDRLLNRLVKQQQLQPESAAAV